MLTASNYNSVQAIVVGNFSNYFPVMIRYKSMIQREILTLTTPQELNDIRECRLNITLVNKLADIGKMHFATSDKDDTTLYCLCLAIGTIIKKYDWGTDYIQQNGMISLAKKIVE